MPDVPEQIWLFDPGQLGASARLLDRRDMVREACRSPKVNRLYRVAQALGISYSTFLRWRRDDSELNPLLDVVRDRKRAARRSRR
jgi:transcriptional regulator with XRE-family HTH domain